MTKHPEAKKPTHVEPEAAAETDKAAKKHEKDPFDYGGPLPQHGGSYTRTAGGALKRHEGPDLPPGEEKTYHSK